jgi:hypothetical protein
LNIGNTIYGDTSTGNVGIGTSSPSQKLDVNGTIIASSISSQGARIERNGTTGGANFDSVLASGSLHFRTGNTERMRVTANGLTFNGDTAAANALDDYEEGTWTPTAVTGITGLSITKATYTKIGNAVIVRAYMGGVSGQSSNLLQLGGLPFTSVSDGWAVGVMNYGGVNTIYNPQARVRGNANILDFKQGSDDSFVGTSLTGHLIFTVTYEAA